jgi:hypothetical protein
LCGTWQPRPEKLTNKGDRRAKCALLVRILCAGV